jgi:CheY-like chemotaxis protein
LPEEKAIVTASLEQASAGAVARILVIEDNRDSADSLKLLLGLVGHQVEVAYSGPAGVELARRFQPQMVLCDIGLPGGMDGFAVAQALRQEPATARACLVALTGYGQEEFVQRARAAGFDRHMTKPVDFRELQALLGQLTRCG